MERGSRCSRAAPRAPSPAARTAVSVLFAAATFVACGARSWLPNGESVVVDDAGEPPPDAEAPEADATACKGTVVPLLPRVPNLYFVLDLSGSMAANNKWENVRTVVAQLIFELGASANFGVTVFPAPGPDDCAAGVEVMPLTLGDTLGTLEAEFLQRTALTPAGGTSTAATFRALLPKLGDLPTATYVILATDGGPNCNAALTACSIDQCTRNTDNLGTCTPAGPTNCCTGPGGSTGCLDTIASAQAVGDLLAAGVKTYVMGIPGSAPYAPVLDALASAGGTARGSEPLYYRVDSSDTNALSQTFSEIAAQTMKSCLLKLDKAPDDPNKLNVYVGGSVVPSSGPNGWTLDGQTVTLQGGSCNSLQAEAGVPTLQVIQGCPTVH